MILPRLFLVYALSTLLPAEVHATGYRQQAEAFFQELLSLSSQAKTVSDPNTQRRIRALSAQVDWTRLARASLGAKRWDQYAAADRLAFLRALQDLLELVVYPKAQNIASDPKTLTYTVDKNRVSVRGSLEREKNGELVRNEVSVVLIYNTQSKKIMDAVVEGEPLSTNLKRQFDEALKTRTFKDILAQMQKRVEEARVKKAS
jgi:ABC-type transporter MlaC component